MKATVKMQAVGCVALERFMLSGRMFSEPGRTARVVSFFSAELSEVGGGLEPI